jgi:hypothetical protein
LIEGIKMAHQQLTAHDYAGLINLEWPGTAEVLMTDDSNVRLLLDVCYTNETMNECLEHLVDGLQATYEVLDENGPGGGWPVVKFKIARGAVTEFMRRYDNHEMAPILEKADKEAWATIV